LKIDPAQEPITVGDSALGTLADPVHKTGRPKADFELREISRETYERLKAFNAVGDRIEQPVRLFLGVINRFALV
jgi:hypothetical protein